jgi:hypothetical protein
MESLFRVALAFVVEYRDVTSIVVNDYTYLHSVAAFSFVEEITAAHQGIWRDVLKRGIATGVFRSDLPVDVVYRSMMGSIVQAVRWYQPKPKLRVDDMAKACASLFLKGLIDR